MATDASVIGRALQVLESIQRTPGITADRIASDLEVSGRAVRRHVASLRDAGIPIDAERGPFGGYRLGRGVKMPPLTFSADEALSLVIAVLDGHHDTGDEADGIGSALTKLLNSLPASTARAADAVRRTAVAAPDPTAARPDPATVRTLVDACRHRSLVSVSYRTEAGNEWDTTVEPWAVVVRHGRWYLVCRRPDLLDHRAYRIDRMTAVGVLHATFRRPDDIDPVGLLEAHLAAGWEYTSAVILHAPHRDIAPICPRVLGRLEPLDDHHTTLSGTTSNPDWYVTQLVSLRVDFTIQAGPELMTALNTLSQRLTRARQTSPSE